MNIVVCLKQVMDSNEVKLDFKTGRLIRYGVSSIINPTDKNALESALVLKEKYCAYVTVISMGTPQVEKLLREALSRGADKAILISGTEFAGADTLATSNALAGAISKLDYDIIFTGRESIDGNTAQVGPELAEHLGIPQVTCVKDIISINGDTMKIKKTLEDGYEVLTVKTPVLLTVIKDLNIPRYINMLKVFESSQKKIEIWNAGDIAVDKALLGISGSATKVFKLWYKEAKDSGKVVDLPFREAASYIISKLKERYII